MLETDPTLSAKLQEDFSFLSAKNDLYWLQGTGEKTLVRDLKTCAMRLVRLRVGDVQVVYPVHLNPNVQEPVNRILGGNPNVHLIEPQDYLPFIYLMKKAYVILTDSAVYKRKLRHSESLFS